MTRWAKFTHYWTTGQRMTKSTSADELNESTAIYFKFTYVLKDMQARAPKAIKMY